MISFDKLGDIKIQIYLQPLLYENSEIFSSYHFDKKLGKYVTDNSARLITGPLSAKGEELEPPLKDEFDHWIADCTFLIKELGFHIISQTTSTVSEKSEYIVVYGIDNRPCGTLIFEIRLSDHLFDATFPEELKDIALQYLKMNKIVDDSATKNGIDFCIEKVTVGSVKNDTWDGAFNRLYLKLREIKGKISIRLNIEKSNRK